MNVNIINAKLKQLREYLGYSQNEISKVVDIPQRTISDYESGEEISGILAYIVKICKLANISVSEFFNEETSCTDKILPPYITPTDLALLKIINKGTDPQTQIEIKKAFIQVAKAILINKADKLKHMPEYKELFGE